MVLILSFLSLCFERLENRNMPSGFGMLSVGDSNHDSRIDNLDLQSAICHLATAQVSRPIAATAYQQPSQPLFAPGGPVYTDAVQGNLADCYVIADLAEVALKAPDIIESMFLNNEDGTYTFRYYTNTQPYSQPGTPHDIVIDTWLPSGYAGHVDSLWAALAEKGLATVGGSYASLTSGSCLGTFTTITGHQWLLPFFTDAIHEAEAAFDSGSPIALETGLMPSNPEVVRQHAYALVSHTDHDWTLWNPHGYTQTLSYADISDSENFRAIVGTIA